MAVCTLQMVAGYKAIPGGPTRTLKLQESEVEIHESYFSVFFM